MASKVEVVRGQSSYLTRHLLEGLDRIWNQGMTRYSAIFLGLVILLGMFGPYITPYEYDERMYNEEGELLRAEDPSVAHPLGTTAGGFDVLSRIMYGARPTVIAGLLGGSIIIGVGLTIGLTSGYIGGRVDDALMRFTDFVYSVPLIPFAIVLLAYFGIGFIESILIIGLLLWRGNARVIRSQVLQIKERPFILSAKATGASRFRIITRHIFPNVASMAVLFFALGIGYAIIAQAGLAFLGVTNPFVPSWGVMIRNAYTSGYMADQMAWSVSPGLMISLTVLSAFLLGRGFETRDDEESDSMALAG